MPKLLIVVPSAVLSQWADARREWVRMDDSKVLMSNVRSDFNAETLRGKDIVIVSRDLLAFAYRTAFVKYEKHHCVETGPGDRWVSAWDRRGGVPTEGGVQFPNGFDAPLHCLYDPPGSRDTPDHGWFGWWDMVIFDEAHYYRNPESGWCNSAKELSAITTKRILLTGTYCVNKPLDLCGLCVAGRAPRLPVDFQDKKSYCAPHDRSYKTVNRQTVRALCEGYINRATEKILNLPAVHRVAINFDVCLPLEWVSTHVDAETGVSETTRTNLVAKYNEQLALARNIKRRAETENRGPTAKDLQQLMSLIQHMQQMVVSPELECKGAARFKQDASCYVRAAEAPTGALCALKSELERLGSQGHARIIVACNHVVPMKIAREWLDLKFSGVFGQIFTYDGEQNFKQRNASKQGFLKADRSILFLSIAAGGCGLHLVPGCQAMIFWGSMPFSPAHVQQCLKRIHRMGQEKDVFISHLVPYGSIDYAIGSMHGDKRNLIDFVQAADKEEQAAIEKKVFGDEDNSTWRKCMKIVDEAEPLVADGETAHFAPMPEFDQADPRERKPFQLLPGVSTFGRTSATDATDLPIYATLGGGTSHAHALASMKALESIVL